jgi:D,D-heptose 1,7-bisphosphate phosphatase
MRRPAVFFDRDNTLIIGNDYLGDPARVTLVSGAADAVMRCRSIGFAVVVVSNQSGVARGMFTEEDVQLVNKRMDEMLLAQNVAAIVDRHEYCPFHPQGTVDAYRQDSFLRKPKPGMILAAAEAMALDLARSWVVGDAPRDIAAGKAAGCRTILIIDPTLAPSPAALEPSHVKAEFIVPSLTEAVNIIAEQTRKSAPASVNEKSVAPVLVMQTAEGQSVMSASASTPAKDAAKETVTKDVSSKDAAKDFVIRAAESKLVTASTASSVAPRPAMAPANGGAVKPITPVAAPIAAPTATMTVQPAPVRTDRKAPAELLRIDTSRIEAVAQQILLELKKHNEARHDDFSISKLIAGIMQILAIATVPLAYLLYQGNAQVMTNWLLAAVFFQTFTVALLIMGRQK